MQPNCPPKAVCSHQQCTKVCLLKLFSALDAESRQFCQSPGLTKKTCFNFLFADCYKVELSFIRFRHFLYLYKCTLHGFVNTFFYTYGTIMGTCFCNIFQAHTSNTGYKIQFLTVERKIICLFWGSNRKLFVAGVLSLVTGV